MIYHVTNEDISWMVSLSHAKRLEYSKVQENFWKMADNANNAQQKWFAEEIENSNVIALCYEKEMGFIIGKLVSPQKYMILD